MEFARGLLLMYDRYVTGERRRVKMVRVSANECQRQWGKVQDMALAEPVTITCKGRDRMVLLSAEEYGRLKKRDRRVMTAADFSEEDIEALERVRAPGEASAFNHNVTHKHHAFSKSLPCPAN